MSLHGCRDGHHHPLQNLNSVVQAVTGFFFLQTLWWHRDHRSLLQILYIVATVIIDVFCRLFAQLTWRSSLSPAVFFLPQQFTGVSRRTFTSLPRLSQASITNSATSFIWVSCQHFATRPVAGDTCKFFTRLPQTRQCLLQIRCNVPTRSSVSPADILLHIYWSYCHSTQQYILQTLHTSGTTLADVHGAHIAFLPWRFPLSPAFSKLLLSFPLQAVYFALTDENSVVYLLFGYTATPSPLIPLVECEVKTISDDLSSKRVCLLWLMGTATFVRLCYNTK